MSIRIYIAGPITDIKDYNKPEFDKAEVFLLALRLEVVNPLKNGLPKEAPWVEHMKANIPNMLKCDAVYALNGWHNSKGARAEIQLAEVLDMPIFEQCEKDNIKLGFFKPKPIKSFLVTRETFEPKFSHQMFKLRLHGQAEAMFSIIKKLHKNPFFDNVGTHMELNRIVKAVEGV